MIEIALTRGLVALVDDEDASLIAGYTWVAVPHHGGRFYAHARTSGKRVYMHRLITSALPGTVVHHVNNNGLDNRRANLMVTTQARNLAEHHHAHSPGVHFHKQTGKYRAQVRLNKRRVSLGLFDTFEAAREAVREARSSIHW